MLAVLQIGERQHGFAHGSLFLLLLSHGNIRTCRSCGWAAGPVARGTLTPGPSHESRRRSGPATRIASSSVVCLPQLGDLLQQLLGLLPR